MKIDTRAMISITEANQNFSKATKLADKMGSVTILKNNKPCYLLIPFSVAEKTSSVRFYYSNSASSQIATSDNNQYRENHLLDISKNVISTIR